MNDRLNEELFAKKIGRYLDANLNLSTTHLARLQAARQAALGRQRRRASQLQLVPAAIERSLAAIGIGPTVGRVLLPLALVAAAMLGYQQWSADDPAQLPDDPVSEIDAQILKGEIPLDAYLDRGFDAWLKRDAE